MSETKHTPELRIEWPSLEDQARRLCHLSGWHYNGDTRVMVGTGGFIELPEAMVAFAEQIAAERDQWRKIAEDLNACKLPAPIVLPAPNETLVKALEAAEWALKEMAEWHGGTHEDDCPLDDTCDCKHKAFNVRVNNAINGAKAALTAARKKV